MNYRNEILEELWDARKQLEKENNNNDDDIFRNYYARQLKHPAEYVKGEPAKYQKAVAA
jgi:hypothetical protein